MRAKLLGLFLFLFASNLHAGITTYDNVFTTNDIYSADFSARLNQNFNQSLTGGINAITAANITNDSLSEADMADEINPRIRTYEGAACEFVYTGLQPATSVTLSTTISAGTAYPLGYRINKASSTNKTFTASKDTYVDIDINGNFQYSEVANGGAVPSVASNSIRLAKVVTSGTAVTTVTDLRQTTCTQGPFNEIKDVSTGASLADLLSYGKPILRRGSAGWLQGCVISWTSHTTFTVGACSAYINGDYRILNADEVVPQTNDDPANGISGLDTGAISTNTVYNIFIVADEANTNLASVSYSTSSTPSGVTDYRKIGQIKTDANSLFTSRDIYQTNQIQQRDIAGAWVHFNGTNTASIDSAYNVSGIVDGGTGTYTVTFDTDFIDDKMVIAGSGRQAAGNRVYMSISVGTAVTKGAVQVEMTTDAGTQVDTLNTSLVAFGELE